VFAYWGHVLRAVAVARRIQEWLHAEQARAAASLRPVRLAQKTLTNLTIPK